MGNFFSEIGKATGLSKITTKGVLTGAAGVVGGMFGGPVGAAAGTYAMNALTKSASKPATLTTGGVAGTQSVGQLVPAGEGALYDRVQTLVARYGPAVLALARRIGPAVLITWTGAQIIRAILGGGGGGGYVGRLRRAIDVADDAPPAIQARVFSSMMPHRHRGITYTELRGFRRVTSLLRSVGMRPKGLGRKGR